MSKRLKTKKERVPKLTEAEYVKYISSLRGEDEQRLCETRPPETSDVAMEKRLQS